MVSNQCFPVCVIDCRWVLSASHGVLFTRIRVFKKTQSTPVCSDTVFYERQRCTTSLPRPAQPQARRHPFGPTTFKQVKFHLWGTPGFPGLLRSWWQAGHIPGGVAILWCVFLFLKQSDEKNSASREKKLKPAVLAFFNRDACSTEAGPTGSAFPLASTERGSPFLDAELGGGNGTASPAVSRSFDALPNK